MIIYGIFASLKLGGVVAVGPNTTCGCGSTYSPLVGIFRGLYVQPEAPFRDFFSDITF